MAKKVIAKKATPITWVVSGDAQNTNRQIEFVIGAVNKLHEQMHVAARNAMIQVLVHRQSTPLVNLLNGLSGKSVHVKGLKDWAEKHGNGITIGLKKVGKESVIAVTFPKIEDNPPLTIDEAMDWAMLVPSFWVENSPPPMFKGFDEKAEREKLEKNIEKYRQMLEEGTRKVHGEIVELSEEELKLIKLSPRKANTMRDIVLQ